nr:uncharacterized protein LOC111506005 isoform X1 [Leptinotarsa decemlineata]
MSTECFKVVCRDYPSDFFLDKAVAKDYFLQFGKVKRLIFKPKVRICTVEYVNKEDYLNALNNAGDYNGVNFKVSTEKSLEVKKKKLPARTEPIWIDKDEIQAELAAMSGNSSKNYKLTDVIDLTDSLEESPKLEKSAKLKTKLKKAWKSKEKKNIKEHFSATMSSDKTDFINLILSQAVSIEDKYRILDARDKLLRVKLKETGHLKSSATVGTCPDMCPEKERLMRETQHQVALYEQEENEKCMDQRKAVKQYSRSSADQEAPLPHELRPVSVLKMTMCYLMNNIMELCDKSDVNIGEWFHFLWDRTRGIRKDITQQELCCQGAVELVEQCARFHIHCSARLVAEDPSVFDQKINTENLTKCLQTLKYMYHDLQLKGETCPNEAEFRAYIVLLNLNDGNFMWEVQQLRQEIQKSNEVKFALQVYSALDKNNYVGFFKLVYSTTYLNACILMRYFIQVRIIAIKTLLKCYLPRGSKTAYPLSELKNILAFEDIETTTEFMQSYGLSVNEENSHVILEKNTFAVPDFPYILDRSLKVVESKRTASVGRIVCGRELSQNTFENHIPQNSFDQKGYLICKDILDVLELEQARLKILNELKDTRKFTEPKETSQNILFEQERGSLNLLPQKETPQSSLFRNTFEKDIPSDNVSIFGNQLSFIEESQNVFGHTQQKSMSSRDQPDFGFSSKTDINSANSNNKNVWGSSSKNIFSQPTSIFASKAPESGTLQSLPKKGGFTFNLLPSSDEKVSSVFSSTLPLSRHELIDQDNENSYSTCILPTFSQSQEEDSVLDEEIKTGEHTDERLKKNEVEMDIIENEKRLEELKREEDQKILEQEKEKKKLKELKKKWQEEELRRRISELQKEDEMARELEISNTVKTVLESIVTQVDNKLRDDKIMEMSRKIKNRFLLNILRSWHVIVLKNKRKRKAIDFNSSWLNTKTLKQSAEELHTSSQDLTLQFIKRYRYGKALEVGIVIDNPIKKVDLFQLTYSTLNKRFYDLTGIIQKDIFWKVAISLPDKHELPIGLNRIEETLSDLFEWKQQNGHTFVVEQVKCNNVESITYCIEKQLGTSVERYDANGIIFIGNDFNHNLQRRIFEHLKGFGVFTKVPIVIILQHFDNNEKCNLNTLIKEKILSDFIILSENLMLPGLINVIEQGLIFLASKVERQPPLELDTLYSFIEKYLCTEIWKRANSFSKWNSHYKKCLQNPDIVLSLYNEGLTKLKKVILSKSCREYAAFPDVFKDYLRSKIPNFLPCNYRYFPTFWKEQSYFEKLEKILDGLRLPKWVEKWPGSNEFELESLVSKYCTKVFKEPVKVFYKVMSILLRNVDPDLNFEDVQQVLWTDVIEILGLEKLREMNLSLNNTEFENISIYNTFVVVYDTEMLTNYNSSNWFYINNPIIKKSINLQLDKEKSQTICNVPDKDSSEDIEYIISKGEQQLSSCRNNTSEMLKGLSEFNALLEDLETSMNIYKRISSKMEQSLQKAIEDN